MQFTGSSKDALAALVFLMRNHQHQCTFIVDNAFKMEKMDSWFAVALVWMDNKLRFPGEGRTEESFIRAVCRCSDQFTVVPLILVDKQRTIMHANTIIIDRQSATLEHFEPYGEMGRCFGSATRLKQRLKAFCKNIFPDAVPPAVVIQPRPSHGRGLQARQELERRTGTFNQPVGFCLAWSTLYASVRLATPMSRPETMPDRMLALVNQSDVTNLTDFIDDFASITLESTQKGRNIELNVVKPR